jgi:hypothetical protein
MNGLPQWVLYLYTHEDVLEKKILLEIGIKIGNKLFKELTMPTAL